MDTIWNHFAGHGVRENYIQAGGIRTRFLEAGSGRPIIQLHGTGGHAETYARNIGPLSKHSRAISLDMIGHGYSDRPDVTYTMDVFADHVIAFMDACGHDKATLCGESLGGSVACWAALKYPRRVEALVLNTGILARPDARGQPTARGHGGPDPQAGNGVLTGNHTSATRMAGSGSRLHER